MKIKKGDIVVVTTGKHKPNRGRQTTGEVLAISEKTGKAIVKGVNIVSKHKRPSNQNPNGEIEKREAAIDVSNIAYLDPVTKKPTKIGYKLVDGKKVRVAKASGTVIEK